MSVYTEFFLNSSMSFVELETIEIIHPAWGSLHYTRNAVNGFKALDENNTLQTYTYVPMRTIKIGASDDLDQNLQIDFGDLGEEIPLRIQQIASHTDPTLKPTIKYRLYNSNDVQNNPNTAKPIYGPVTLQINSVTRTQGGATLNCSAPRLNQNATGELYTTKRFPMLLGFVN